MQRRLRRVSSHFHVGAVEAAYQAMPDTVDQPPPSDDSQHEDRDEAIQNPNTGPHTKQGTFGVRRRQGNEIAWWANPQIAPIGVAKELWEATLLRVQRSGR